MKRLIRILCIALVVTVISGLSNVAFAATVNCQYTGSKTKGGAVSFTATATKDGDAKITFKIGTGKLVLSQYGYSGERTVYGAIEVSIKDSKGNEVYFGKGYNSSKKEVSFKVKKNETYTVRVWNWNPLSLARFYLQNRYIPNASAGFTWDGLESAYWKTLPTIKATTPILFSKIKIKK